MSVRPDPNFSVRSDIQNSDSTIPWERVLSTCEVRRLRPKSLQSLNDIPKVSNGVPWVSALMDPDPSDVGFSVVLSPGCTE